MNADGVGPQTLHYNSMHLVLLVRAPVPNTDLNKSNTGPNVRASIVPH